MLDGALRSWLASNYHALVFAGLDRNLWSGQQEYARFIILGRPRTGSTFLRSTLNSHGQIFTFGELFRHDLISGDSHLGRVSGAALADYSKRPIAFIKERVFRSYPAHIRAVGFKLFYHHARNQQTEPLWTYLLDDRSIRVIHIKRRNLLKTLVSHKVAWLTGKWKQTDTNGNAVAPSITLSYEECEEEFRTATAQEETFDLRFGNHPLLSVCYEDLVKNFSLEIHRIERFLDVASLALRPSTAQQGKRPMAQQISNYYELKERFQQTSWAQFFTE